MSHRRSGVIIAGIMLLTGCAPGTDADAAPPTGGSDPPTTSVPEPPVRPTSPDESVDAVDGPTTSTAPIETSEPMEGSESALSVDPESSGEPWAAIGAVEGLLTFRGNPTRSWYGRGPVPTDPTVVWKTPIGCSNSTVAGAAKEWCGTGWTGQPLILPAPDSTSPQTRWWLAFGAFNRNVNFLDPADGHEVYPAYETGDIIKGTPTADPDGYPLLYTGSRDNHLHVVALDRSEPEKLWSLAANAVAPTLWNNDWDGSPLVLNDYLLVGGENSRFFVVKLNRGYNDEGLVTVDPEIVFSAPGWDDDLLSAVGSNVSIEGSVAVAGHIVYFSNSGGLVQGWDLSPLGDGRDPRRVFRFWNGDDTDASVVVDADGSLYVASQYERGNARATAIGQIMKLDPSLPADPLVWSIQANDGLGTGVWATPALWRDLLIVATDDGRVLGLDRDDGTLRWQIDLPGPLWQSPVVVDDVLVQGDCAGVLHAFDLPTSDQSTDADSTPTSTPRELWAVELGGCIESTPAVWDGRVYVGTRDGWFYALADVIG